MESTHAGFLLLVFQKSSFFVAPLVSRFAYLMLGTFLLYSANAELSRDLDTNFTERKKLRMLLLQTHVGLLIVLWFLVRSLDLALSNAGAAIPRWPWAIVYGVLTALLLIALFVSFH